MKLKSASAENLGNIMKRMINTALEDSDQIAKLHRAICENAKDTPRTSQIVKKSRSRSDLREILSWFPSNLTRNASGRSKSLAASNNVKYLPKRDINNNVKINNRDKSSGRDTPATCNKSVETNVCIERDERRCEISAERECTIGSSDIAPSQEIIEVWSNSTQGAEIKKLANDITECESVKRDEGKLAKRTRKGLSFESWKEEKNLKYRKLLKEAEERRQWELRERVKDLEYKQASQEAYARIIREKEAQQRELSVKLQAIRQTNAEILQKQMGEKRAINAQAFDAWKRRKALESREAKLMTIENAFQKSARSTVLTERPGSLLDSWLNQLNSVLHKKYLRERRHLVRSFYCQPT